MGIERPLRRGQPAGWLLCLLLAGLAWLPAAQAQELDFRAPATTADPALPGQMRDLADRLLPVYQDNDMVRYLENISALQLVTGNWVSAWTQRQSLLERRHGVDQGLDAVLDLYAHARVLEQQEKLSFAQAWTSVFRQTVPRLSDPDALDLDHWLKSPVYEHRNALQQVLDRHRGRTRITLEEGLQLVKAWLSFDAWRTFSPVVPALVAQDQRSRYQQNDVVIHLSRRTILTGHVILPRAAPARLDTLLEFRPAQQFKAADELSVLGDEDTDFGPPSRGLAYVIVQAQLPTGKGRRVARRRAQQIAGVTRWVGRQLWSNGHVTLQPETGSPPAGAAPPVAVAPAPKQPAANDNRHSGPGRVQSRPLSPEHPPQ